MPLDAKVEQLLDAHRETAAASEVIRGLGPRIRAYLRAVLRDDDDAEDAFSLFSEWTWKSIGSLRDASSLRSWAYGVAWHAAMRVRDDPYRRRKQRLATEDASKLAKETTRSSRRRKTAQLEEIRATLDPGDQNLLVLRIDQSLEWEEIAHVVSAAGPPVTAAALRKRFERLKERIATAARERGILD
ncbi:MAG TPA: sigma-70 family RNA polymerase sigma factor [Anaeromyxobacteraceae bacterium]|nr:sigma-70 family RNA polymerase sigma factor [Anaeromyxobacteraceae bacterium]